MGNLLIGWPNRIDASTLSGGTWSTSLPLNNIKSQELALVARSTAATTASTQFIADLGTTRSLRAFALVNHNLSQNATWKVSLGTTSGGAEVYAGSFQAVWALTFAEGGIEWEANNWWGAGVGDGYTGHPFIAPYLLPASYDARYVKVEIDDTTNSAGYVQIGRAFIGGGFVPAYNASYGLQDAWTDLSTAQRSDSGAVFSTKRRRARQTRFALNYTSLDEGAILYEIVRRQGTVYDVLYLPNVSDYQAAQRYGYLGLLRELSALEYPYPNARAMAFAVEEML
jgi:hypothetical protein